MIPLSIVQKIGHCLYLLGYKCLTQNSARAGDALLITPARGPVRDQDASGTLAEAASSSI